ncbi:unnamed protein product [Rotaria sp. Silwood2]|nr:unnamed protein product [Rotaria sp. Silwood2]CAF4366256.1 unnamed protein product [Rotaria sp. Silwood2]
MKVVEDIDTNHPTDISKMDIDNTNEVKSKVNDDTNLWNFTIYAIMPPCRTFVAPEHKPLIIVDKSAACAERFDFIGAINGPQIMPYMTLTPTDRKKKDVKGVRKEVVNE